MSNKSLVRSAQNSIVTSKSVSGAAGKAMIVAGAGGLLLTVLAALIPFVGIVGLSGLLLVLGFFLAE